MLIPLLFVLGFALYGLKFGQKLKASDFRVGAALPAPTPILRPVSYVAMVNRRVSLNLPVSDWLHCEAMREAFDAKDWDTVQRLSVMFDEPGEDEPEFHPEQQGETDEAPVEKPAAPDTSPLDGVELDDWQTFVQALATKPTGHKSDKYVGQYEQNLSRLRQLGIETPASEEQEYKALVQDMTDYWESEDKLIQESSGEVIQLSGQEHPVTPSGILGLLKAAGPQGARSWLASEQDRTRFPRTTETFLRCNGCF